ncbi:MAG: N-acetyl-gamma-glutamyl-phosphate reductase [Syntrophobacterales bacterium RBG_19FT_COMBO_59_10]|nr:MAG: N-acetyl-gamma-glutamyl-phosphate reductase [Syntrophobacterales bacterium RBG_19FT_COMBO_59_10]
MVRVGIYGGSGYTGQELLRLLVGHPEVTVVAATSRRFAGVPVAEVYPVFSGLTDLVYTDASPEEVAGKADFIFLALPHGVSMEFAPVFIRAGRKVVDLSADFRLRDAALYEAWYGRHTSPETLGEAVYGLPELYRDQIRKTCLVANPGCYPTSIILGLAPLLNSRWIDPSSIIADSKSGVSGAGREPQIGSLYCEVAGGFKAYKVGGHRHTPEIEQELSLLAEKDLRISFTPHLLPVKRGILSTIYATLAREATVQEATDLYREFYRDESFVRICRSGQFPNLSSVVGSNYCDIGVTVDKRTGRIVVVAAIDNLIKGASGQAIQNMNIMSGFREETGLPRVALFP